MADREEFERRLLALVRNYLDEADEWYPPAGYDIEDFIVIYQVRSAPEMENLQPWHGGPRPGWTLGVAFSSTTGSYWHDEALLAEALQRVRDERDRAARDESTDEPSDES